MSSRKLLQFSASILFVALVLATVIAFLFTPAAYRLPAPAELVAMPPAAVA